MCRLAVSDGPKNRHVRTYELPDPTCPYYAYVCQTFAANTT